MDRRSEPLKQLRLLFLAGLGGRLGDGRQRMPMISLHDWVGAVVHLAASGRDQPGGSIEELNAIATWRMVDAAERAKVDRFVYFSALGATTIHRTRLRRSKALAERVVRESDLPSTIFAPSLLYARGGRWLDAHARMALLPAVPMSGLGRARFQPMWAPDAADCVLAVLDSDAPPRRVELAGPQVLTHAEMVRLATRGRPLVPVPTPIARSALNLAETALPAGLPLTWDEAELLEVTTVTPEGPRDAQALGVQPRTMADALGR
jgi:NADH dehydrogenase